MGSFIPPENLLKGPVSSTLKSARDCGLEELREREQQQWGAEAGRPEEVCSTLSSAHAQSLLTHAELFQSTLLLACF